MSYRVHPEEDRREYRSPPQLYQTPEQQQLQPPATSYPRGQRANTPERIRERQVKSVPSPYTHTPVDADFYIKAEDGRIRPNVELLKDHFLHEGRLREDQALFILEQMTQLLSAEPNMLRVAGPVTVCGDIHGQYYDLMKVFEVGGTFANNNYLFLGDYVDRGCFGIECLLYLYAIKLWHPTALFLLRGNHECKHLTEYFTFKRECYHKYSPTVYDACVQSFNALPITALIDGKFFCVHGGISPELQDLSDLDKINRFAEPGDHGLLCDLLWADPIPTFGHEQERTPADPHGLPPGTHWVHNKARGCSFYYTYEAACKFLERNQLLGIFRAHEAQDAGYTMHRKTPTKKFPSVITIFSAPNYLDFYHNRGAVIKYKDRNITIRQYNATSHPYWLPNFMDAFTWSLPFVGSKITEMLLAVLSVCSQEELESSDEDEERGVGDEDETRTTDLALTPNELSQRRQQIKNKILAVGRMQRVFQLLREESEAATELTTQEEYPPSAGTPPGAWPGGFATPPGTSDALGVRVNSLQREIRSFDAARRSDMLNERLPQYKPQVIPLVAVPSMRLPSFANADDSLGTNAGDDGGEQNMEALIRKALVDEGINDGGVVERLAEKIARGKKTAGRPKDLKRFETAP